MTSHFETFKSLSLDQKVSYLRFLERLNLALDINFENLIELWIRLGG